MLKQKTAVERHSFFAKYLRWMMGSWRHMGANNANTDPKNYFGALRRIALEHKGDPNRFPIYNNYRKFEPYSTVLNDAIANEYQEIERLHARVRELLGQGSGERLKRKFPQLQHGIGLYDNRYNNINPIGFTQEQIEIRQVARSEKRRRGRSWDNEFV